MNQVSHVADIYPAVITDIVDRHGRGQDLPIRFLPSLNDRIGGFRKRKLNIIAGRPSQGKSTLMINLAMDWALQGKMGLFFTFEMPTTVCIERMISNYCEIDNFHLLNGLSPIQYEQNKLALSEFYDKLKESKLIFVESYGKTFPEVNKIVEQFDKQIDFVIIDYVQMIKESVTKNSKEVIDEYIKAIRTLALQKNFCCILGSQINRATHEQHKLRKPEIWELKGCIHPDSIIGNKTIKSFVENKCDEKIKTFDIRTNKITLKKPSTLIRSGIKKCIKIKTKSGKEIILSVGTKLYDGVVWRSAKTFEIGQKILVDNSGRR